MTATDRADRRTSPDRRRGLAILTGSTALHAVVLGLIGLGVFDTALTAPPPLPAPPIYIEMEPRPLLDGETARVPTTAPARPADAPALTRRMTASPPPRPLEAPQDRPTAPAPRAPAPAAGITGGTAAGAPAPAGDANPWSYRPESRAAAVGRSLRTGAGGCRIMDGRLSPGEQALCDDRFNAGALEAARRHPPGARTLTPSEQRREAAFAAEGRRALEQYESLRAPLRPGGGNVMSGECAGGNFGTGCAGAHLDPSMREGATTTLRQGSNRAPGDQHRPLPGHEPN